MRLGVMATFSITGVGCCQLGLQTNFYNTIISPSQSELTCLELNSPCTALQSITAWLRDAALCGFVKPHCVASPILWFPLLEAPQFSFNSMDVSPDWSALTVQLNLDKLRGPIRQSLPTNRTFTFSQFNIITFVKKFLVLPLNLFK